MTGHSKPHGNNQNTGYQQHNAQNASRSSQMKKIKWSTNENYVFSSSYKYQGSNPVKFSLHQEFYQN